MRWKSEARATLAWESFAVVDDQGKSKTKRFRFALRSHRSGCRPAPPTAYRRAGSPAVAHDDQRLRSVPWLPGAPGSPPNSPLSSSPPSLSSWRSSGSAAVRALPIEAKRNRFVLLSASLISSQGRGTHPHGGLRGIIFLYRKLPAGAWMVPA